jgi:hypothetical protein
LQAICDAALAGHGLAWLPCWMVIKEIQQGDLVPLLKQAPDVRFDVHAVWQQAATPAAKGKNCHRYAGQTFTGSDVAGVSCVHKKAALKRGQLCCRKATIKYRYSPPSGRSLR